MRNLTFRESILEATDQLMERDPKVYIMGLGVTDPKGIFGTTLGLFEKYGPKRVIETPVSENAMTGIAIGSAVLGMKPIVSHQRVDFFLLALDQLINNAAKWHYMFGGQMRVPLVIRLIIGRGWGQGPQHSQTLHSWFAHVPGLKVVAPSSPYDAKGLLIGAVESHSPVIYMEHRWLHQISGEVPQDFYSVPLGKARIIKSGSDLTVIGLSHATVDAFRAALSLEKQGISVEVLDLRSLKPLDKETILASVGKTKRVVVVDPDWKMCGFASEIITLIAEEMHRELKSPPKRITYPDRFTPTSWALANQHYPTHHDIFFEILKMFGQATRDQLAAILEEKMSQPLDVPDQSFTGPF